MHDACDPECFHILVRFIHMVLYAINPIATINYNYLLPLAPHKLGHTVLNQESTFLIIGLNKDQLKRVKTSRKLSKQDHGTRPQSHKT